MFTFIAATPEMCFDLSLDVDLHKRSMKESGERAIGGKTSGLLGVGEEVIWEARHFGIRHEHHSRITVWDRPVHFRDIMVRGRFKRFEHDHYFAPTEGGTRMRDIVEFESPLGFVGSLVNSLFLTRYLTGLIRTRNELIRQEAEAHRSSGAI